MLFSTFSGARLANSAADACRCRHRASHKNRPQGRVSGSQTANYHRGHHAPARRPKARRFGDGTRAPSDCACRRRTLSGWSHHGTEPTSARRSTPRATRAGARRLGAQLITRKGVFGIIQGHQNPHLAVDPNTGALFVGVGSAGNIGVEPEPKATIQRFDASRSGGGPRRHLADAAPEWCFARRGRVRPHDRRRPALPDDHCAMTRQCGCNHSGSECQQA